MKAKAGWAQKTSLFSPKILFTCNPCRFTVIHFIQEQLYYYIGQGDAKWASLTAQAVVVDKSR
jgi:hypothetical protein